MELTLVALLREDSLETEYEVSPLEEELDCCQATDVGLAVLRDVSNGREDLLSRETGLLHPAREPLQGVEREHRVLTRDEWHLGSVGDSSEFRRHGCTSSTLGFCFFGAASPASTFSGA